MQKKFLSGLFWLLLLNLIVKPLWLLGVEVGVQNTVGNSMYGIYISIFNFSYIFNILLDLGITNFNTRNLARHPQLITKHLGSILSIKILLLLLYLVITFSVGLLIGYRSNEFNLLALLSLCQFLNSLILYLRSNFEGLFLFRWDSLLSVLDRLLMIVICGLLLWGPTHSDFTIYHFVYSQVVAYSITALTALIVLIRKSGLRRLSWSPTFFRVILRRSLPYALLVLLMASYNRLDPILLRFLASESDAGIYAGAFRLLDAISMIAYLVSVPLLPIFSRLTDARHASPTELTSTLTLVTPPVAAIAIAVATTLSFLATPLMQLLYPAYPTPYIPVFRILIFGIIPICFTYIFGTLLTAAGELRRLNMLAACTLLITITLNLLLIPHFGATGSAIASLLSQTFMALTQTLIACKLYRLPTSTFACLRLLLFVAIIVASNILCLNLALPLFAWLLIAAIIAITALLLLRLIDMRHIFSLLTSTTTEKQ